MVIKGQKAIGYIWFPMNRKNQDETDPDTGKKVRMAFGTAPVFDVSQTELIGA